MNNEDEGWETSNAIKDNYGVLLQLYVYFYGFDSLFNLDWLKSLENERKIAILI